MAYNTEYRISYYRKSGGRTTIDILEDGFGGSIIDLLACGDPLEIAYDGTVDDIYKPSVGSGITIRVVAVFQSLKNLFTTNPQKFIIKIYNGISGSTLVWQGFITPGIYNEQYSSATIPGVIVLYGNDGMTILEDMPYTYTGLSTLSTVMGNIFSKLNISYTYIHVAHTFKYGEGVYAGSHNLFTMLTVNNENYFNENGEPMTCRQVLDSIFGGLALTMRFAGVTIYILDPIDLYQQTYGWRYTTSPTFGSNEASLIVGVGKNISNRDLVWAATGQNLSIIQPYNSVDLEYDPYNFVGSSYGFNDTVNTIPNAQNVSTYDEYTNNGTTYRIYFGVTMVGWTYTFEGFKQISPNLDSDIEFFIRQLPGSPTGTFTHIFPFSNIRTDPNLYLEVSMDVYVNTKHVSNYFNPVEAQTPISSLYLQNIQVKVGEKWYHNTMGPSGPSDGIWYDSYHEMYVYVREKDATITPGGSFQEGFWFWKHTHTYAADDQSNISDKWVTSTVYIPVTSLSEFVMGSIQIIIPKALSSSVVTGVVDVRIKNVSVQMLTAKRDPIIKQGVVTNGAITGALYIKKKKLEVKVTNGTGFYGCSKGAFLSDLQTYPGSNIAGLQRQPDATYYPTQKLIMQSFLSQYKEPRYISRGTLDVKDVYFMLPRLFIYDSTYLKNNDNSTKYFCIGAATYHDREETADVELLEICTIREAII